MNEGSSSPFKRADKIILSRKGFAVWVGILAGIATAFGSAWTIARPYIDVPDRIAALESKQITDEQNMVEIKDLLSRIDERQKARIAQDEKIQNDLDMLLQRSQPSKQ